MRRPPPALTPLEISVATQIGLDPAADTRALAASSGTTLRKARQVVACLRAAGAVRVGDLVDPRATRGRFEVHALLSVDWSNQASLREVEARLAANGSVVEILLVAGKRDLVIRAFHEDERAAKRWFENLIDAAGVKSGELRPRRTVFDRSWPSSGQAGA